MQKSSLYILGGLAVLVAGFAVWQYYVKSPASYVFEFAAGESVSSWNFQGVYTGNPELEARATKEIGRLKELSKNKDDDFTDYEIEVSYANQHHLLGDGKKEYDYLMRALALDSQNTGLAWNNLGFLLETLGAYQSARVAFENAYSAQRVVPYAQSLLEFLQRHYPSDPDVAELKAAIGQ